MSYHRQQPQAWNWQWIKAEQAPSAPLLTNGAEQVAQAALVAYQPTWQDKLFRRVEATRSFLAQRVIDAQESDRRRNEAASHKYQQDMQRWQQMQDLAERVLKCDLAAFVEAVNVTKVLARSGVGVHLTARTTAPWYIEVNLNAHREDYLPSEVHSVLASGKLSTKKMPKGQFNQLYQDHVSSCALRLARELFALLPVDLALIHVVRYGTNTQTGKAE